MKVIIFLFYLLIIAVALALGAKNGHSVNINYLIAEGDVTLSTVIAFSFVSGVILTLVTLTTNILFRKLVSKKQPSSTSL